MTITYHSGKRLQGIEEDRERTQGNRGGANAGSGSSIYGGGGGGGAGAVGADSVGTGYGIGGAGGNGTASSITGSPVTYAGGGGGGGYSGTSTGGSGGGGDGAEWSGSANGTSGTDYYGGGGGGCSYSGDNNGGSGGKGVVILQFTTSGISYSQTGTYDTPDTSTVSGKTILRWTGSGTFVLSSGTPDVEYLVVAGGGGGGGAANNTNASGGGGAGGMLTGTISSMSSATYTVTIGDGGIAGVADLVGGVGGNSVFSNITATGGGGGACNSNKVGRDGGSGSGAASASADIGGVSLKATTVINVPAGSRFEETDTRKFYTKDVNGWQEKGTELGYRHDSTYAQNQPAEANPFTTINKQHFVEWFSGKQIPSYWDYNQLVATVTPSMYDDVGGGYRLTTNTATNAKAEIRFAGKRQFDLASSECIVSMRYDNVAYSRCMAGLSAGSNITNDQTGHNHYTFGMQSNENLSYLYTKNSSGNTQVSSGNNPTTSWQTAKMVSNGSKVELYLLTDGVFVLSCEDSTYPPTGNADPYYGQWTPTAVSTWSEISYFEAYNT